MIEMYSLKDPVALVVGSLEILGCSTSALRSIKRRGTVRCCGRKPNISGEIKMIEGGEQASFSVISVSLADTAMACTLFVCVLLILTVVSSPSKTALDAVANFVLVFESLAMFAFGVYLVRRTRTRLDEMVSSEMGGIASEDSTQG
jgi:hypothetical protein